MTVILMILKRQDADTDADGDGDYVWDNDEAQDIHDNDSIISIPQISSPSLLPLIPILSS